MQITQADVFQGDNSYTSHLAGRIVNDSCDIQLHDLNWTKAGVGSIQSSRFCFLEMLFCSESRLQGAYSVNASGDYQPIGELVFVPPGVSLTYDWTAGRQRTVSCMFDVRTLGFLRGIDWDWSGVNLFDTLDVRNPYLLMGMRKLRDEAACPGFASELHVDSTLAWMALELHRHFIGGEQSTSHTGRLSRRHLKLIDEMIDSSWGLGPSLDQLAAECGIPARRFSIMFKQTTGSTLRDYVARARISRAKLYLEDRKLLIKEVAYRSGFQSAAGFTAAFRKATGISPAEYRVQVV